MARFATHTEWVWSNQPSVRVPVGVFSSCSQIFLSVWWNSVWIFLKLVLVRWFSWKELWQSISWACKSPRKINKNGFNITAVQVRSSFGDTFSSEVEMARGFCSYVADPPQMELFSTAFHGVCFFPLSKSLSKCCLLLCDSLAFPSVICNKFDFTSQSD